MKNSKLKIEDFLGDSLTAKQALNVLGSGLLDGDIKLPPPPKGGGTGGTGSGPVNPDYENPPVDSGSNM